MFPFYPFASASHYQRQRLSQLLAIFPGLLLANDTERIAMILPELYSLLGYRTGGAFALGRAWLALERGDFAVAITYCEEAIHTGLPTASLAAITRLVLAKSVHMQGQEALAINHLRLALAQAESPATPTVIAEYASRNGIPLPPMDE